MSGTRLIVAALAVAIAATVLAPAPGAAAKRPKTPEGFVIDRVHVDGFDLRWDDVKGERRYQLARHAKGRSQWSKRSLKRNKTSARTQGQQRGTVHRFKLRACKRRRCSPWTPKRTQATSLHRLNGPFPDPYPSIAPPQGSCASVFPDYATGGNDSLADLRAFNQDVSSSDVVGNSAQIINEIQSDGGDALHPDFGSSPDYGIPYVVVPGVQPKVPVKIGPDGYPDESDFGPAPVPPRSPREAGSDHHVLVVDRDDCELWELYRARYRGGARNRWQADSTAFFDLGSFALRPAGFTSADAAGLPIFAGLVSYDEVVSGEIDHAIRITFSETRNAYIPPATHRASDSCEALDPPMGMRLRLNPSYPTASLGPQAEVIAEALQTYGAIVADNGSNFFITGTRDSRWDDEDLNDLNAINGDQFQVVESAASQVTPC
jgi:hypothetical protein